MTAHTFFPREEISDAEQRYARNVVAATNYMLRCNLLAGSLALLYAASVGTTRPWNWWEIAFISILFGSLYEFRAWGTKVYKTYPRRIILIGSAFFLLFFIWAVVFADKSTNRFSMELECWLFSVGLLVAIDRWIFWRRAGRRFSEWSAYNWAAMLLLLIPMLFYFARVIYPIIRPSWSGGSPTHVIVYFSRDSRILPNQELEADLMDESESGMYIVKRGEKQAIFVPRQSVSALYFADQPLAPESLKHAAPSGRVPVKVPRP
jgi:hypothetical protein